MFGRQSSWPNVGERTNCTVAAYRRTLDERCKNCRLIAHLRVDEHRVGPNDAAVSYFGASLQAGALPNLRIASDKDVPVNANCCRHIDGDTVPAQMIEFPPLKQASGQRKLPPVIHTRHLPRPTSNITMTMPAILHCH